MYIIGQLLLQMWPLPWNNSLSSRHFGNFEGEDNVPFFLTHQTGFTLDLAFIVEDMVDRGMTFQQIENLIEGQYKTTYGNFERAFWQRLRINKARGTIKGTEGFFPPNFPLTFSLCYPKTFNRYVCEAFSSERNRWYWRDEFIACQYHILRPHTQKHM